MKRPPVWLGLVALGVGIGVVATIALNDRVRAPAANTAGPGENDPRTVEVSRRNINVVVAVDGTSVALPIFSMLAPNGGIVRHTLNRNEIDERTAVFKLETVDVTTPVTARFERWLVPDNAKVVEGVPVVELRYVGFGLRGSLPAADAYRILSGDLKATGAIDGGPAGFACTVLQAPSLEPNPEVTSTADPTVVCAIPQDVRVFAGLKGQIAITSGQVKDVLALPVTAVSGRADLGEVSLVLDDGTIAIREVRLGATDGAIVEIVSGLEAGMRVLASPPALVRQR